MAWTNIPEINGKILSDTIVVFNQTVFLSSALDNEVYLSEYQVLASEMTEFSYN